MLGFFYPTSTQRGKPCVALYKFDITRRTNSRNSPLYSKEGVRQNSPTPTQEESQDAYGDHHARGQHRRAPRALRRLDQAFQASPQPAQPPPLLAAGDALPAGGVKIGWGRRSNAAPPSIKF